MCGIAHLLRATFSLALAATVSMLPACGGGEGTDAPAAAQPRSEADTALQGVRVSGRDEAMQIIARGVLAPLLGSELTHAVLTRAFELRALVHGADASVSAGDRWLLAPHAQPLATGAVLEAPVAIEIEAADHADGLLLRGETGFVRARLRFDRVALGAASQIDGEVVLEVSRKAEAAGASRSSRSDALSFTDDGRTLHWSYLVVEVDAQQMVQRLNVVSDVPVDGAGRVWLDVTTTVPGRLAAVPAGSALADGRYVASGVTGFLRARLTLLTAADGAWTVAVDNDKDDQADFVVQASADEVRARVRGL